MLPPKTNEDAEDLINMMESYYSNMFTAFEEDNDFYEGNIEELITVPEGFDVTIPTTARAIVDEAVDNIEPYDLKITYAPRGFGKVPQEDAERIIRFLKSVWAHWRTNNSDVDVVRDFIKNLFKNGKAVFKLVPDWTLWPELADEDIKRMKPEQIKGATERIKRIREQNFPMALRSIDPQHIMEDPTLDSRKLWVIERYDTTITEVRNRYMYLFPELSYEPYIELNYEIHEMWTASYVDEDGRYHQGKHYTFLNREVRDVEDNEYDEVPYVIKYSGFGREAFEGSPELKATGFYTRQVKSMLRAEARRLAHFDAIMSQLAFPIAFLQESAHEVPILFEPGAINYVPDEVLENIDKTFLNVQIPDAEYQSSISMIQNQIERATTQRAIRGAGVPGTDSAAQLQMITAQAKLRLEGVKKVTEQAVDLINKKVLWFVENVYESTVSVFGAENGAPAQYSLKPKQIRGKYVTLTEFMPSQEQVKERKLILLGEAMTKGLNIYDALVHAGFDDAMEIIQRNLAYEIMQEPAIKRQLAKDAAAAWGLDTMEMELQEQIEQADLRNAVQGILQEIAQQTGAQPGQEPEEPQQNQGGGSPAVAPQAAGAPVDQATQPLPNANAIIREAGNTSNV